MHMSLCLRGKDVCDACFCACLWIRDRCQHRITRGLALATFFWGPSPLWLSPSLNRPDSWAGVCHKCACLLISMPPSLQVSACWCLMGGLQKTLPGRCTWASTRRTAGEGLSLRWCCMLPSLLSFNPSTTHSSSLILPPRLLLLPLPNERHKHKTFLMKATLWHVVYTCTCTYSHTACGPCLSHTHYRGGHGVSQNTLAAVDRLHYCLKQLS